jgi:DNA-binding NarL/FixJ family response regulator
VAAAHAVRPLLPGREPLIANLFSLVHGLALGSSNAEIAAALVLVPLTVKTHVNRAMAKVGAPDQAQLVVLAHRTGLVHPRMRRPGLRGAP